MATRVTNNLWLCSWEEAKSLVTNLDNPLVINCTKDLPFITENTIRIPIDDTPDNNDILKACIFKICKKINDYIITGSPVVVHCLAGMSRSCSVIECYLSIYTDLTDTRTFIRKFRPNAMMFDNFKNTIDTVKNIIN